MMSRGSRPWVCIFNSYYVFFFFSCHFFIHPFNYFACYPCYVVTDKPKEPKATVVSVVPTALIPTDTGNLLALVPPLIKILLLCLFLFFVSLLGDYTVLKPLPFFFSFGLSLAKGALSTRFEVGSSSTTVPNPMSEAIAFLLILSGSRQMTLIW